MKENNPDISIDKMRIKLIFVIYNQNIYYVFKMN